MKFFDQFLSHTVLQISFFFLRLGTQTLYSIARASTKDSYEKREICNVSLERMPTCFTRAAKRFTDSFTAANRNRLTSFSCVCCRLCYQTLEFYCGKTGQALELVKCFEMSILQSRENKQFCLICLSIAKSMSNPILFTEFR